MPIKKNPLNLNSLQLRTLTLFQALASLEDVGHPEPDGGIAVGALPHAHGNHFHLGPWVVMSKDATGLQNPAPWLVLERKGLIRSDFPHGFVLTPAGQQYETDLRDEILHGSDH